MDEVKDLFKQLMNEVAEIRKENSYMRETLTTLKSDNDQIKQEIHVLKNKIKEFEQLDNKMEKMEKAKRKNNLIITEMHINNDTGKGIAAFLEN